MSITSRMSRTVLTVLIIASVSQSGWSIRADELTEMMARAEALYYEADFEKSVELLLRADELLKQQPGAVERKTKVKLQLALGLIGLNDSARAKTYLGQLYALDSDYPIDYELFAPKVIRLAEEAKAEQNDLRCRTVFDEAQRQLNDGKGDAVGKLISSSQAKCSGLAALRPKAADLVFKEGLETYKKTQMPAALQKFRAALVIQPDHDLAAQYLALTEGKLELTAERALLAWRKDFDARDFVAAARDYQELSSLSGAQTMAEVRMEYRRVLSELVDYSNRACAGNDTAGVEKIRTQINALLPDPSLGDGILSRLTTCAPPPRASAPAGCIHMDSQYALTRLKSRVDPQFPPAVRSQIKIFPVNVSVKARIDEKGNVVSGEPQGGSPLMYPAIRAAVDQWKFFPAIIDGEGVRCVETEIPFVINVAN